ncbi:MAG TPA: diaminopimelate epimerase [Thermoanaerobaculia bacterium]|nr:diaminopimelate epimerase [Thermoanaerobaculia bacterium]
MTRFFKVSGSGNDFLALAEPSENPAPERIRAWCRRGVSLGADGLFVLRRNHHDGGDGGAVTMDYFNADGLPADLCLNGTRCAAQLAFHLGWANGEVRVETAAGPVAARRLDAARVTLDLPTPAAAPREVTVEVEGVPYTGYHLVVGVPHFVLPWPGESLEGVPVEELGRPLRFHPAFGAPGANVNFVRFPARQRMEIRTYERGVEAETLSCGSGVLAAAAAGLWLGQSALPLAVVTRGGFVLEVAGDPATGRWSLSGDARVVAHGDLLPGAALAQS